MSSETSYTSPDSEGSKSKPHDHTYIKGQDQSKPLPGESYAMIGELTVTCQGLDVKATGDTEVVTGAAKINNPSDDRQKSQSLATSPPFTEIHALVRSSTAPLPSTSPSSAMSAHTTIDGHRRAQTPDPPLASFFRGLRDDRKINSFINNQRQVEAPQTPTPLPRRLHRRQNANLGPIVTRSPAEQNIRCDPTISPTEPLEIVRNLNEDQFRPAPYPQTPFSSAQAFVPPLVPGAFGVFYPQTPAFITGGNPVPTPYNGHFPFSPQVPMFNPGPQRAMRSVNWRERTHMPSAPHHQVFAQVSDLRPPVTPGLPFAGSSNTQSLTPHLPPRSSNFTYSSIPGKMQHNGRRTEPVGVRYGQKVNFYGYVPSSLHRTSKPTLEQVKASRGFVPQVWKIRAEQRRAITNWPKLISVEDLEEGKYYAQWAGSYVDINDDLIARCICPADLLQHPCPWDEFEGGCQMELEKYTDYKCPDWEGLNPEQLAEDDENYESRYDTKQEWERRHESKCPHIHGEVEPSCRFIASFRKCTIVLDKAYDCAVGHDLEAGRQVSRSRFEAHVLGALHAGATRMSSYEDAVGSGAYAYHPPALLDEHCWLLPLISKNRAATCGVGNGFFLHHLPLYSTSSLDLAHPERFFIPYLNVGYLEVRRELIERICPADLCGKECPFNNIYYWEEIGDDSQSHSSRGMWRFGCRLLRLCESVQARPFHPPPPMPFPIYQRGVETSITAGATAAGHADSDASANGEGHDGHDGHGNGKIGLAKAGKLRRRIFRLSQRRGPKEPLRVMCKVPVEHPNHDKVCPFIHNVEKTCRYVGRMSKDGVQNCPKVWDMEGSGCQYGHDFEQERMAAFDRLKEHVREAELWKALPGVAWRNQKGAWMGLDQSSMVFEVDQSTGMMK
ncbi:hypothetical protein DV736_g875, partial [Chaetothyriales sp. CBS 134916]